MSSNPWAAAAAPATNASNGNPMASASAATEPPKTVDPSADPFASPDSVGGSGGPRGPKWSEIIGRIVVLKPLELLTDQPVPNDTSKKQNIYVTQLTVLGPDPVTVYSPATEKDGKTYDESTEVFETPYTWDRWYAYGKGVEVKLAGVHADPSKLFLLGVVRRCPIGSGYRKGETWQTIEKRWNDYRAAIVAGREIEKPAFSWGVVDCDEAQTQQAIAWYRGQQ